MRGIRRAATLIALAGTIGVGLQVWMGDIASAASLGNQLAAGGVLSSGDSLDSYSGTYQLLMQTDGNLVEYGPDGQPLWQTSTNSPGASLVNGDDGNLAIQAVDGTVVWSTSYDPTRGPGTLTIGDDGNLVDQADTGSVIWVTYVTAGGSQTPAAGAVLFASEQVGKPYQYGAVGPSSYDTSGLILASYAVVGVALPHNTMQQYAATIHISRTNLQPGDLVFYSNGNAVAIYIGDDVVIGVFNPGSVVQRRSIDFSTVYACSRVG
jgi:hypothetical protein